MSLKTAGIHFAANKLACNDVVSRSAALQTTIPPTGTRFLGMANSRFSYVKHFELDDKILPQTYIVVRVDGRGFTKFTERHGYTKPNDARGIALMVQCAAAVMSSWGDLILAFGESDEFSFVFAPEATIFGRRSSKLSSGIVSLFSASFVFYWSRFFPTTPLLSPPSFDARCVPYPTLECIIDYCKWRQVDTYINSTYNEAFWALIQIGGRTAEEAHAALKGTLADKKHEIMFGLGINFSKVPAMFRRGSTLVRDRAASALILGGKDPEGPCAAASSRKDAFVSGAVAVTTVTPDLAAARESAAAAGPDFVESGRAALKRALDIDPGVDCGPLAMPESVLLCFPDFAKEAGGALLDAVFKRS